MSTDNSMARSFIRWEADLTKPGFYAFPPGAHEKTQPIDARELEYLQLSLEIQAIKDQAAKLGAFSFASLHSVALSKGYRMVYVSHNKLDAAEGARTYLRFVSTTISQNSAGREMIWLEDFIVDYEGKAVRAYTAEGELAEKGRFDLPDTAPPQILRDGSRLEFPQGKRFTPMLPEAFNSQSTFEALNESRQQAVIVSEMLGTLSSTETEDLRWPYAS